MAKVSESKKNIFVQGTDFLSDAWAEVKKVHYPSREETIRETFRTLFLLIVVAFFLSMTDFIVGRIVQSLLT
jgi:preprotein translocase subunit SecE